MLTQGWGLFQMNQLPPSTGRMTKLQSSTGLSRIWLENNTVTRGLQLSLHSVPLTPCSISLVPLRAH